MKKYFFSMLLLAVAGMSATSFVSCVEETIEEAPKQEEAKQDYYHFQYFLSNDAIELTDITLTGISALDFKTNATFGGIPGKLADVVFTGKEAEKPKFSIKLDLKSNWKELLSKKDEFRGFQTWGVSYTKGEDPHGFEDHGIGGSFDRETVTDNAKFEEFVSACVKNMGY